MTTLGRSLAPERIQLPRLGVQRAYPAALLVIVLGVLDIAFSGWSFSSVQALGITNQALPLALVAVGETFVMLTNGIDLSVGGVVTIANVVVAVLGEHRLGNGGVVLALIAGAAAGLVNGLVVNYARIAPLIVTLATSSIFLGIALIILPTPGGAGPAWLSSWSAGQLGVLPVSALWLLTLAVGGFVLLRRTAFGLKLQALGGSESSLFTAGVKVRCVRLLAYVSSGLFAATAGVVLTGLTQGGDATIGAPYLLAAIAAVVIGGTSLSGGVGTLVGAVLGALALSLIGAVLEVSGLSQYLQYIVTGGIVIGALYVQSLTGKQRLAPRAVQRGGQ